MATNQQIVEHLDFVDDLQVVSKRKQKVIDIVEYNPEWPAQFATIKERIINALGERALSVEHVGSTSVPGLPAKDTIDVDLVVEDPRDEDSYIPALEKVGFQFLHREPQWYQHRFLGLDQPYANIHVFGPDAGELVRHKLFREWLINNDEDLQKYVEVKRAAAKAARENGEGVQEYNYRKQPVIHEILDRVFRAHGLNKN
jgi:GrpB-like predicted nucleotidyltransferase (UPF0157 family)